MQRNKTQIIVFFIDLMRYESREELYYFLSMFRTDVTTFTYRSSGETEKIVSQYSNNNKQYSNKSRVTGIVCIFIIFPIYLFIRISLA